MKKEERRTKNKSKILPDPHPSFRFVGGVCPRLERAFGRAAPAVGRPRPGGPDPDPTVAQEERRHVHLQLPLQVSDFQALVLQGVMAGYG